MDSNRDELYYQSDYSFSHYLTALFGFHYENERGSYVEPPPYAEDRTIQRTNFEYTLQLQGEIKSRVFYSAGGSVEKNHLYGITGAPRLGLSYNVVRPGAKWFRGTLVRANAATGVQEPSLAVQFASLYTVLQEDGLASDIAKYHVTPIGPQDSRTYDLGVDQNIRGEKLVLKLGYYHNSYNHQVEGVDSGALEQFFNIPASVAITSTRRTSTRTPSARRASRPSCNTARSPVSSCAAATPTWMPLSPSRSPATRTTTVSTTTIPTFPESPLERKAR